MKHALPQWRFRGRRNTQGNPGDAGLRQPPSHSRGGSRPDQKQSQFSGFSPHRASAIAVSAALRNWPRLKHSAGLSLISRGASRCLTGRPCARATDSFALANDIPRRHCVVSANAYGSRVSEGARSSIADVGDTYGRGGRPSERHGRCRPSQSGLPAVLRSASARARRR